MASIRSLLAAIGIGGTQVEIEVEGGPIPRGAPVLGKVILKGGIAPQRIERVWLQVHEFEHRGKGVYVKKRLGVPLAEQAIVLGPHQTKELLFQFRMPHDMRRSSDNYVFGIRSGCRLTVDAPILWAVDPRTVKDIPVSEHREIMAIKSAMRRFGFEECWKLHLLEPSQEWSRKDYRANGELAEWLDGATVELSADEDFVRGRLILDRRELTMADRLHALGGADKFEFPIQIPSQMLLDNRGQPNVGAAIRYVRKILDESMLMPSDARNVLLRPAGSPNADILLRPAGTTESDFETLLRPSPE